MLGKRFVRPGDGENGDRFTRGSLQGISETVGCEGYSQSGSIVCSVSMRRFCESHGGGAGWELRGTPFDAKPRAGFLSGCRNIGARG